MGIDITTTQTAGSRIQRACIVMPTYNEAQNINWILDRIGWHARSVMKGTSVHVLIVDDNSPDGTADIVKQRKDFAKTVHILERKEKNGLGEAYIAGMQYALQQLRPTVIFEMDADGSHDPHDIPRMVWEIQKGYDIVIGSRYVKGGELPEDWGFHRKFISTSANTASRSLLLLPSIKDCTGGFRAIRASLLRKIDLDTIQTSGYVFQVVLLEALVQKGARVQEIPIRFHNRKAGQSKLRMRDVVEGGMQLVRMAGPRWTQQVREMVAST